MRYNNFAETAPARYFTVRPIVQTIIVVTTDVKTYQVTRLKRSLLMISHFNEGNIKGFLKLR